MTLDQAFASFKACRAAERAAAPCTDETMDRLVSATDSAALAGIACLDPRAIEMIDFWMHGDEPVDERDGPRVMLRGLINTVSQESRSVG